MATNQLYPLLFINDEHMVRIALRVLIEKGGLSISQELTSDEFRRRRANFNIIYQDSKPGKKQHWCNKRTKATKGAEKSAKNCYQNVLRLTEKNAIALSKRHAKWNPVDGGIGDHIEELSG